MYLGPPLVYALSQRQLHLDWRRRLLQGFPLLALLGIGIAWCSTKAVWRGLTRWGGTFARTPKFQLEGQAGHWSASGYRLQVDRGIIGEISLALYALTAAIAALITGRYGVLPFTLLYAIGFGTVAWMELTQALVPRRSRPPRPAFALGKVQSEQQYDDA